MDLHAVRLTGLLLWLPHDLSVIDLVPGQTYSYIVCGNDSEVVGPYTITVPDSIGSKSVVFFGDFDSNWYNGNKSQYTFEWFIN